MSYSLKYKIMKDGGHESARKLGLSVYKPKFMNLEETGHACLEYLHSIND